MFLIPTGVDTDNTHSDEYDIPKAPAKKLTSDKKWYNDTEKNLASWGVLVAEGKTTPQQIIDKIESEGYSLSTASKNSILNLF